MVCIESETLSFGDPSCYFKWKVEFQISLSALRLSALVVMADIPGAWGDPREDLLIFGDGIPLSKIFSPLRVIEYESPWEQ